MFRKERISKKQQRSIRRSMAVASLLLASTTMIAQDKVTGVVKGSDGEPLIGVYLVEVGTHNSTVTDANGNYTLTTKPNARLKVTYLGYAPKVVTTDQAKDITLEEDATGLEEVVVVGYGTMRRKDVTSSIVTVQAKDLGSVSVYD